MAIGKKGYTIEKVGVVGAGVMGSGIAAHLASAGFPVVMVDIVPRDAPPPDGSEATHDARNAFAAKGLDAVLKIKPAAFQDARDATRITVGNLDDDLALLGECDWVVEAVTERLDIKRALFRKLAGVVKPGTLVTSNTSGIPLVSMVEGLPESFRKTFIVTHFFNPVRYMRLVEIITGPETDPRAVDALATFIDRALGKGVVYAKDTINFIANRIGVHGMMATMHEMLAQGLSIEEVDTIVGEPLGRPKSAAFRTADIVGLDTLAHVAKNCADNLPSDEEKAVFALPGYLVKLIETGRLGQKTKAGFYKKEGKDTFFLDPSTDTYLPKGKPRFDAIKEAKGIEDVALRVKTLCAAQDKAGVFAWTVTSRSIVYAANRFGEIADDIVNIDRGMRWGFNWALGPFEVWDALGVQDVVARLKSEGRAVPKLVTDMLAKGATSFYTYEAGVTKYWDPHKAEYATLATRAGAIVLKDLRAAKQVVATNDGADLIDLGDGVACLAFHTKMNAVDGDILDMMGTALEKLDDGFDALVIANDGEHFSAGANLMLIYMLAQNGEWAKVEEVSKRFQDLNMRFKYSAKPVVTAPHGFTFGGGCEVSIHGTRMHCAAETYMGLVEVGVGLLPGAGGTKEMLVRALANVSKESTVDRLPFIQRAFETIGMAKVATGAGEARKLGFLREFDTFAIDGESRIEGAKRIALQLVANGYRPPLPPDNLVLPGADGRAAFELALYAMKLAGQVSVHDALIGKRVAHVLCGGESGGVCTEQQILDLEREAFMSLVGEEKSQARISAMLMTGKPLRN